MLGRGGRRDAASARRKRCRGTASCRPGQTDHGERGKRPVRVGPLVAARQGPMPADGRGAWRSPRSSPRAGKPSTWRRRTAGAAACDAVREVGCEGARAAVGPRGRTAGTGMADQAAPMGSPGRPGRVSVTCSTWSATPRRCWSRGAGETQPGVTDRRCRWPDPRASRAGRRGRCPRARLRQELKDGTYRPLPARERLIPKRSGKLRSLGISTVRDRIVQTAAKLVLEPIFEAGLLPDLVWISARATNAGRHRRSAVLHQRPAFV